MGVNGGGEALNGGGAPMPNSGSTREDVSPRSVDRHTLRPRSDATQSLDLRHGIDGGIPLANGEHLTHSEFLVVTEVVRGASSKEAARALGISPRTVEFHRANALHKLGARNTAELVRMVVSGVLDSTPEKIPGS